MSLQSFSVQRFIPESPELVLTLVADVRAYPSFIPWIKAMRVWSRREEGRRSLFSAEAIVGYSMLTERFATTVVCDREARTVTTRLIQGPFRALDCRWTIVPHGIATRVDFAIDYEFSSPILATLLAANFGKAVGKLMDAFETEAEKRGRTERLA